MKWNFSFKHEVVFIKKWGQTMYRNKFWGQVLLQRAMHHPHLYISGKCLLCCKSISSIKLTIMSPFFLFWEINKKRLYDDIWISIIMRNLMPKKTFYISYFVTYFLLRMFVLTTIPFDFHWKEIGHFTKPKKFRILELCNP